MREKKGVHKGGGGGKKERERARISDVQKNGTETGTMGNSEGGGVIGLKRGNAKAWKE